MPRPTPTTATRISRGALSSVYFSAALLLTALLSILAPVAAGAQSLGSGLLGGAGSGTASQILNQLQGGGGSFGGFGSAGGISGISGLNLGQLTTPGLNNQGALPPLQQQQPSAAPNAAQANQAAPAPPSSIELMFSTRLPPGSSPLTQFGYDFFQRQQTNPFAAISDSYVVGPGDVLVVYLWGDSVDVTNLSNRYELQVDRNGTVFFPPVGSFSAAGLSLSSLRDYLKSALSRQYKKFDVAVTLQQMRQFPVYVSGFVNAPGPVLATTVNSVFDLIAGAGGVMKTGSLRNIVVNHADGGSDTIDLYDVLISGKSSSVQVREGDSIFVPQIGRVAAIAGSVKRPAIYELKGERSVSDLIALAGGLLPSANRSSISIVRFDGTQRQLIDSSTGAATLSMNVDDGDLVRVDAVRDYVFNNIEVEGEAMYPGSYSVDRAPTLRELLSLAGLLPDTDLYYGRIYRTAEGGVEHNITFAPHDVLNGSFNAKLEGRDRVVLYPFGTNLDYVDFDRFPNTVTLEGDIRYPGMYAWKAGMKLGDILSSRNFLVDTNAQYAVVVRQEIGSNQRSIETFVPSEVVDGKANVELHPLDRVQFFPKTIFKPIEISGAVKDSKVVQYYSGIDLIDVLRVVSLNGDPTRMKAYIYRQKGTQTISGDISGTTGTGAAAGITGATEPDISGTAGAGPYGEALAVQGPGVAPPIGAAVGAVAAAAGAASSAQQMAGAAGAYPPNAPGIPGAVNQLPSAASTGGGAQASALQPGTVGSPGAGTTVPGTVSQTALSAAAAAAPTQAATRFVVYLNDFLRNQGTVQFPLQPGDKVVFAPTDVNEKNPQIIVRGQVNAPGSFLLTDGMHLSDVLREAGGYTKDAYPDGLVLLRKSAADLQRQQLDRAVKTLQLTLQQNIASTAATSVTSAQNAAAAQQLQIQAQQAELEALQSQIADVLGRISINLPATIDELKGTPEDLLLENGDTIFVPKTPTFVQIIGDVFNPVTVAYRPGLTVKDYLALAGGPTSTASRQDAYVILADGTIQSARQRPWVLFGGRTIDNDPVTPGETIVVPQKQVSTTDVLPIVSQIASTVGSIASTALSVMAILKL